MVLVGRTAGAGRTTDWCSCDGEMVLMRRNSGANATGGSPVSD